MPQNTVFGGLVLLLAAQYLVSGVSVENEREQLLNDCLRTSEKGWTKIRSKSPRTVRRRRKVNSIPSGSGERYPPIKWIESQQKIAMQAALTSIVTQLGARTPPPERTDALESKFGTTFCKDGFTMDPHRGRDDSVPPNLHFSDPTLHQTG